MYQVIAENLEKEYRIYARPVDRLIEAIIRRPRHVALKVLRGVSFSLAKGECLGVIGDNGAGKSTLLKILAGTLTPSTGTLHIEGRVSALLELGAGFHPEFTGLQNIYLNASLQGFDASEIKDREGAIIEFAELGDFIHRPIKTYSSGMVMRLAFSIATTVDPDILIVDEALAVGDQHFQQKCVGRMTSFKEAGKTIIFCSHSMYLVGELCDKSIWLDNGVVRLQGDTSRVIAEYLADLEKRSNPARQESTSSNQPPRGSVAPEVVIEKVEVLGEQGLPVQYLEQFSRVEVKITTRCTGTSFKGHLGVGLVRPDGELVFASITKHMGLEPITFTGTQSARFIIPSMPLASGTYQVRVLVADEHTLRAVDELTTVPFIAVGKRPELGSMWIDHEWETPRASL